ncbi:MAG TPA: HEAT repeat domain-containing protein [Pirellulales bacterium]|nr:HEAT repeat domain-containing protein [Pirellulales bacterium]
MKLFRPALRLFAWTSLSLATLVAAGADAPPLEGRFSPLAGFEVQEVVVPGSTGSLVAMAFNETGDIIASREQGPLLLVRDADHDGKFEAITTFCDKVTNCQGILPLEDRVLVIGNGPSGAALYRLTDSEGDGTAEKVETLFKFKGSMGEHGPHAPVLGPDGLIYLMIGNHTFVEPTPASTSPHHHYHNAELFTPKYEDANGHAAGIKAPGGTVIRTDVNGSFVEVFCGGFRNAYDHAFNHAGELFTFDSDMEWDVGLPWYRPTRVNHLIAGGEYGWRSGWSKWPDYYVDSLPTTLDIGRGSPTGVVFYDHTRLGPKYAGTLFMCDWSQGRILAATLKPAAGTYHGEAQVFLEGRPLNCSDIDVGPDGWLYISVGGRGTAGSIFRVVAAGAKPIETHETGILRAIRQPQLASSWARRQVREVKKEMGDAWGTSLQAVAVNPQASGDDRARALDLLQRYSPPPSSDLLVQLSSDADAAVRAKATYLLGVHPSPAANDRLVALLEDADPTVRRRACEALVRSGHRGPAAKLETIMAEREPFVAWAATRALEQVNVESWRSAVLHAANPRLFLLGSVALLTLDADRAVCQEILDTARGWLDKKPSDEDFTDLLRVIELAVIQGQFTGDQLLSLRDVLSSRFPARDYRAGRELCRLLTMLQDPTLAPRLVKYLETKAPLEERIQAAMIAPFLKTGWTPELRSQLLEFCTVAKMLEGGNSYKGYLTNASNDVLKSIPPDEQLARIRVAMNDPATALGLVQALAGKLSSEQVAALVDLDKRLAADRSPAAQELAKATITALGFGDDAAAKYLQEVFDASPDRRSAVAQAVVNLASRSRREADWQLLIRSLAIVEGATARDVLKALAKFPQKDDKPQDQRQVLLLGLKLGDQGGKDASMLLQHWTGQKLTTPRTPWPEALAAWQKWFVEKYPDQPEPVLPVEAAGTKWTFAQLLELLSSDAGRHGDAERGGVVFEKAQCIKCHRYANRGEGIGPDLSNVSSRFQRKEILESVVFPSQVISDQFAAKTVLTTDGKTYTGLVGPTADGVVVLQANTEKATIAKADIDTIVPSKKSAMPDGLFNTLSLEEIADLFAYLAQPPAGK